jgi:sugar O-acyltransferase (sialic acid O-acetyltransferase NeuD family)
MSHYLYGAGGHGKVVLDAWKKSGNACVGFVDDKPLQEWARLPVFSPASLSSDAVLHLAIGNSMIREKLSLAFNNHAFFNVIHPMASIACSARVNQGGSFLAAHAIIGPEAQVGLHTIINHGAIVDHDCNVGNFCHIAPNAVLGGGVTIGNHVLIGAGAVVLPGLRIADHVTIGAGAVVTKDILNAGIYVGTPARTIG